MHQNSDLMIRLREHLSLLDINDAEGAVDMRIEGEDDPIVASPHRLAGSTAVALTAYGASIAAFWQLRSKVRQSVSVNMRDSVYALNPAAHLYQNGYKIDAALALWSPAHGLRMAGDGRFIHLAAARNKLRRGLLELLDCANTTAAVDAAVSKWTAQEFEDACGKRGLPGFKVRTTAEWRRLPHAQLLAMKPVVQTIKIDDTRPFTATPGARPLSGIKVLDVSHILAGPGMARTLAEQGADVLRISSPRVPDEQAFQLETGFGKRAAFLDLTLPEDCSQLKALVREADVFIQSYRPGRLAALGFSREAVSKIRPGIVHVDVSCFGDGPWGNRVGFDPSAQAAIGIMTAEGGTGLPRGVPTHLLMDYLTAYIGAGAVVAALAHRARQGGTFGIDLSLARTGMWVQDFGLLPTGAEPKRSDYQARVGTMASCFGELRYLLPATMLSETPGRWDLPPVPLGASKPEWCQT